MNCYLLDSEIQQLMNDAIIYKPFKIVFNGKPICIVKTEENFFGISNICPHAGAELHHGFANKRLIIGCHLHGYKFDMKTGLSADGNQYKIPRYSFKEENGEYYILAKQ